MSLNLDNVENIGFYATNNLNILQRFSDSATLLKVNIYFWQCPLTHNPSSFKQISQISQIFNYNSNNALYYLFIDILIAYKAIHFIAVAFMCAMFANIFE